MQPSFTAQTRARNWSKLITWFRCICRYRQYRGVVLFTPLCLTHDLKTAESSLNSSHWIYESQLFLWAFTPAKIIIYQSRHSNNLAGILIRRTDKRLEIFAPFQKVWSFGFLCTTAGLCDVCVHFFCLTF